MLFLANHAVCLVVWVALGGENLLDLFKWLQWNSFSFHCSGRSLFRKCSM